MGTSANKLRYERIADQIEHQIAIGSLAANERVPSLRAMSRSAGVSIGTVVQAYLHLERRGILHTCPRSGHYVTARRRTGPEPRAKARRSTRPASIATKVIDLVIDSFGREDLVALNSAIAASARRINGRLNSIARTVLREHPANANDLTPVAGLEPMRREVAKRLAMTGVNAGPEDVVITSGTMEALTLSLGALCKAGDTVLIESPTYFGILQVIERLSLKVVEVPNRPGAGIDVAAIERAVDEAKLSAAILQSSFNNPTGALTPDESKEKIVEVLTRAGIPIIEDDIYGDLHFGEERPRPFGAFDRSGLVITCGSISKTVAIGYRLGWAVSPSFAPEIIRAKFCSSVACPTLQQHIIARYLKAGLHDRHIRKVREDLGTNCRRFREAIEQAFPSGTRVSCPAGGVVLWIELPRHVDGVHLFEQALEQQIGIAPGMIFSARGDYGHFVRLSAGIGWSPRIERALGVLGALAG
jgi:DNA-binding transcriptional MocR family regulator